MTPEHLRPRRLLAAAVLALAAAAVPASADLTYALNPVYQEGVNGNNGWYKVDVTATYTCTPPLGYVATACPAPNPEKFTHQAGTAPNPAPPPARIPAPIVRSATFAWDPLVVLPIVPPPITQNITLVSATGAGLKVDTSISQPTLTAPTATTYDAGSIVPAKFTCNWSVETSGQWPLNPCAGTVPAGANIDTGAADTPATYGPRTFTVTQKDLAGNTSVATVRYTVDELPGPPALSTPAPGATVDARPTFTWTPPPPKDDGSGLKAYRLTVTPSSGSPVTFEVTSPANPVVFTPLDDLPAGAAKWSVTFIDKRDRTAATGQRNITLVLNAPGAPKLVNPVARTSDPRPAFSWTPAEPGGTFQWEIASAGTPVQGPTSTPATTMTAAALSPGSYTFRVRQISGLGRNGAWSAVASFVVDAIPVTTTPTTPTPTPTPPTPTPTRRTPPVQNPRRMKPRAGAGLKAAPVLHWVRQPKATLYNVQVFRVYGTKYIKVLTAFPRGNALKLSRKKILKGRRYVWRVWPYIGGTRRYTAKPLGVSWFAVKK